MQSVKRDVERIRSIVTLAVEVGCHVILLSVDEADFVYLKEKTGSTSGNLSVQIDKLSAAEYIRVRKEFVGKKTRTSCQITEKGREAFEAYVNTLKEYINW